mmetsp:Transcript_9469/g.17477  ORF Transcript_9469/g.17477 Transcript_9469/m.17477 type:complete len:546 (-) Transcript_9469:38-1675(-)
MMSMFGYTNNDNPFGDSTLTEQFVWSKKEKSGSTQTAQKRQFDDRVRELEQVRQRRKEREAEIEALEKLREEERRLKESEMYGNLQEKEEAMNRAQEKNRSRLRLLNKRAQLVDEIYTNFLLLEEAEGSKVDVPPDLRIAKHVDPVRKDPSQLLAGYGFAVLEDVLANIGSFVDKNVDVEFWTPIQTVIATTVARQRREIDGLVNRSEREEVHKLLQDKTEDQLIALRDDVEQNRLGRGVGNPNYWGYIISEVSHKLAKLAASKTHAEILHSLGISLDAEEDVGDTEKKSSGPGALAPIPAGRGVDPPQASSPGENIDTVKFLSDEELGVTIGVPETTVATLPIVDELEDLMERKKGRNRVIQSERGRHAELLFEGVAPVAETIPASLSKAEVRNSEDQGHNMDQAMTELDEVKLPRQVEAWHAKYEPRKPRYFNRVRTGYDWNIYNKTHYDSENPPPKAVQGYKFNIYYPDLVDKSVAPTYKVLPSDEPDFAIIKFHAGAPYEDIAFKIVNKEWAAGRRSGFRCTFERDRLQLWFQLKRLFYRR